MGVQISDVGDVVAARPALGLRRELVACDPTGIGSDRAQRQIVAAVKGVNLPIEELASISDRVVPLRARAKLTDEGWLVEAEPERGEA